MDKFYNLPCLAQTLKTVHKTDCVSTLKLNQNNNIPNVPKKVKDTKIKKRWNNSAAFWPCFCHKAEWQEYCHCDFHRSHSWWQDLQLEAKKQSAPFQCWITISSWEWLTWKTNCYTFICLRENGWTSGVWSCFSGFWMSRCYTNNTGKRIYQLSFRILLVEGLFGKYVLECNVLGRVSSDNTVTNRKAFYRQASTF